MVMRKEVSERESYARFDIINVMQPGQNSPTHSKKEERSHGISGFVKRV